MKKQKRVVCGGILICQIKDKHYILCVRQRRSKKWGPPKGGVEGWESDKECAEREIFEETGVNIKIGFYHEKISIMNSSYFIVPVFSKKIINNPLLSYDKNEIDCVSWLNIDKLDIFESNRHLKEIFKIKDTIKKIFQMSKY